MGISIGSGIGGSGIGSSGIGGSGISGSSFSPLDPATLFSGAQHGSYYDISDFSTVFQTTDESTPVTAAGQPVRRINDKSGNGFHLFGGTGGTLRQDARGKYYVEFSAGAAIWSAVGYDITFPHYIFAAVDRATLNGGAAFCIGTGTTNRFCLLNNANFYRVDAQLRNATANIVSLNEGGTAPIGFPVVLSAGATATEILASANGSSEGATTATNTGTTMANCRVGINITGAAGSNTSIDKFYGGMSYAGDLTDDQKLGLSLWFKDVCGVSALDSQSYDIFCIAGQSNAVGVGDAATATSVPFGEAAQYIDGIGETTGALFPMAEPTRHYGTSLTDGMSTTGSAWSAFCEEYFDLTGRHALIVGGALSGNGLTTGGTSWAPDTLLDALVAKAGRAKSFVESRGGSATVKGVLWLGGEADALAGVSKATFKTAFADLLTRFRAKFGISSLPILALSIDRTTDPGQDAAFSAIRDAISESAAETDGIYLVMSYQDFVGSALLVDSIHWNQTALNTAGQTAATNAASVI